MIETVRAQGSLNVIVVKISGNFPAYIQKTEPAKQVERAATRQEENEELFSHLGIFG